MVDARKILSVDAIVVLTMLAMAGFSLFMVQYAFAYPENSGRNNTGFAEEPVGSSECPSNFFDISYSAEGVGSHEDFWKARDIALNKCQADLEIGFESQKDEMITARIECESVKDCVFSTGDPGFQACTNSSYYHCSPHPQIDTKMHTCTYKGIVNYTGYSCKKKTISPPVDV